MSEAESRQGRTRNAERTREIILDAAETVFAEHGFDGARIDVIAHVSGYNKSLIGQYFGDKLGLYGAVLQRIDREASGLIGQIMGPLLEDETIVSDVQRFRAFLKRVVGILYDYMVEHPRLMRMLVWEHAEGWQTYAKLASLFEAESVEAFEALFKSAQRAGVLRSDFDPLVLFLLAEQICWTFPTSLLFYQMALPNRDFSSAESQARAREQVITFIVAGMMVDPGETRGSHSEGELAGE